MNEKFEVKEENKGTKWNDSRGNYQIDICIKFVNICMGFLGFCSIKEDDLSAGKFNTCVNKIQSSKGKPSAILCT